MELKYGTTSIPLEFKQPASVFQIKEPLKTVTPQQLKQRLAKQLNSINPDLSRSAIVVGDKTRLCGYSEYLPVVLDTLQEFGVVKENVRVYIAYGTHLPQSEQESVRSYGPVYYDYTFVHHDCNDPGIFESIATTTRGTEVFFRKDIADSSFLLTFGAISHHYFAGYGGGRKLIFPGLGYKAAIYQNHSLFLDSNTQRLADGCMAGCIEDNPLAEDLAEIESFNPADLSIHGILNSQGVVCDLLVGSGPESFRKACALYGEYCETREKGQFDLVIASCGGFPKDINFIQSHKAIHNASFFVKDNGHLIVLAECRDGVGSKTFLPWLEIGNYQTAFETLARNYEGNGGTALAMMEKSDRIRISLLTTLNSQDGDTIGFDKLNQGQIQTIINSEKSPTAVIPNASLLVKVTR